MSKWTDAVKKLDPRKLREKLKALNEKRKKQTAKGHDHQDLDAQARRLKKKIDYLGKHHDPVADADGTAEYISPAGARWRVAAWMVGAAVGPTGTKVNWLAKVHATGHWAGELYSAYRSPIYSEGLCLHMCNATSCPGTCAGRASLHSQTRAPGWGALDVKDPEGFERGCTEVGAPFHNDLPNDPNHHSPSGH